MSTTVLQSLNQSLHAMMREDERVLVIGEDILDPYGGAFKVTRGLSTAFPQRVLTTPISEAGFTGAAAGMAMRGLRPIVEIMFGDFLMLAADQLLNYISKCSWMYNGQASVPMVIRTPMGGRRGYGPTHSQSIEKHFLGMPGLTVVAVNALHPPGELLRAATLEQDGPVLFIEHKLLYPRPVRSIGQDGRIGDFHARSSGGIFPVLMLSHDRFSKADVTIVAYGYMAELALEAAQHLLMEEEILCEVVVPTLLSPFDHSAVRDSLARSGALLVCEEGTESTGWAAEVITRVSTHTFPLLRSAPRRLAARNVPLASSRPLEEAALPQAHDIIYAVLQMKAETHVAGI